MLRRRQSENIKKKAIKENIPYEGIANALDAAKDLDQLFIQGRNKLESEFESAQNIPEDCRYIISKNYLEQLESHGDKGKPGVIA